MKFGKKQLVLASLVLALGAAVYLNWQFAGTNKLPIGDDSETSSELGAAQLVNNAYVETVTDDLTSSDTKGNSSEISTEDAFAQARMNRQNSRDEALEMLDGILQSADSDPEAKKAAVEQAAALAQNVLKETNVENLLQAKGYEDSVVYLTQEDCNVVVAGEINDTDMLIIQEIVMEQSGFSADRIKIIGTA